MRFIVDKEPTDPKECPFYTKEVDSKNLANLIFSDDEHIVEMLDICHFDRCHSRYCRLRDGDNGKCPYLVSYPDYIREREKMCCACKEEYE